MGNYRNKQYEICYLYIHLFEYDLRLSNNISGLNFMLCIAANFF